jgi:cytochrome c553
MIGIRLTSVVALALLALTASCAKARPHPDFIDLRDLSAIEGNAEAGKARATTCMACHGAQGIAPVPQFPSLAGQHAEYLYGELLQIQREARVDSPMTAQVANLDDDALRDLAAWFASLPAAVMDTSEAADGSHDAGQRLYREGDPGRGVPPCQGCHGTDGQGHVLADSTPRWRVVPKLRGQHAPYLMQRLRDFRDGKHASSSSAHVMSPIAATLDDAAIDAIAQWIGSGGL